MATATVLVTGNTFPVKDQIKALGGRWDADAKGWRVPADKAAEAQSLVAGAPKSPPRSAGTGYVRGMDRGRYGRGGGRGTRTGCSCGSVEEYEKASDCSSCRYDR